MRAISHSQVGSQIHIFFTFLHLKSREAVHCPPDTTDVASPGNRVGFHHVQQRQMTVIIQSLSTFTPLTGHNKTLLLAQPEFQLAG